VGLEVVEIVMDVEETFGISLPDARVSEIRTVGELNECIADILGHDLDEASVTKIVLDRLRSAITSVDGTAASRIDSDTRLPSLFPYGGRKSAWKRLEASLDLPLPPLDRPRPLNGLLTVVAIALGWLFGLLTLVVIVPPEIDPPGWLVAPLGVIFGLLAMYLCWRLGRWLTLPLARIFPRNLDTVGNLTELIVRQHYGRVVKQEQRFSRDEVWSILQEIVAGVLRVDPQRVTPEARFVEDLGAG
jgi:acyl carrier protein